MGSRTKITPQQIWIVCAVLSIISVVVIYFTLIKPGQDETDRLKADYDQQLATANKMPAAKKDYAQALKEVAFAKDYWARYDRRFMPRIDLSNRWTAMQQVWREEIITLAPLVDRFLRADHSVQIVSADFKMPTPPSDPNEVVRKQYTFQLGSVAVVGTFNDVLNNASRWSNFNRLVLMDNLSLSGSSPRLTAQYTLTCYEFLHDETVGPQFPTAPAPTATGGGGGGGGLGGFEVGGGGGGAPGGMSSAKSGGFGGAPPSGPPGLSAPGGFGGRN